MKAQKPKKAIPHGSAQSHTEGHAGGFTLVITEKPSAARRIADALAEGELEELKSGGVGYYRIRRGGKDLVVVSAAGHLFSLTQKEKSAVWTYPVFSVEWKPTWESNRLAGWSKKYYDAIKAIAKGADSVISSCDFDIEGSTIAFNIIRFLCSKSDGKRMRFSTLTRQDLIDAYDNASEHLDFPQIDAGLTRHHLDFLWGINMSRALTLALQHSGGYKTLSTGRVQGPVLQLLDVRQREIEAFKPVPFWILQLEGKLNSGDLVAIHTHGEFWKKSEAEDALARCKGGKATVDSVEIREYHQSPPFPFDLTTLQRDAYLHFHYSPKQTLDIAQSLYEQAVISYPRTSSQKLPDKLGFKAILNSLWKQSPYKQFCEALLKGSLRPNEGPKSDSAHPAIYPTGLAPKALNSYQKNIYDLITRRFLATFADAAKREAMKITIDVSGEKFAAEGARTLEPGWMEFYKPYVRLKEQPLPPARKGDNVSAHKILMLDKETQPPKRLTQASILKEMEKLGLGTKCLSGETNIICSNGGMVNVASLFDGSFPFSTEEGTEIRRMNTPHVISLSEVTGDVCFEKPEYISRRMLSPGERMVRVDAASGSISCTSDHPFYVFGKGGIVAKEACNVRPGDRLVSLLPSKDEGDVITDVGIFDASSYKTKDGQIVHKFSAEKSSGVAISKFPIRWSSDIAWLLGYFYGDGSYSPPKYNGSHQVYFTTTEKKALQLLKTRVKNVFGVEPHACDLENKFKVNCNAAISYLLASCLPEIKAKKEMRIPNEFVGDFLRGLFDADGNVHLREQGTKKMFNMTVNARCTPRIKLTLANMELLGWVDRLLGELCIKTTGLHKGTAKIGDKKYDCWTIRISGRDNVEKFAFKVGFDAAYKEKCLYEGLRCDSPKYNIIRLCTHVAPRISDGMDMHEIIRATGLTTSQARKAIKRLVKFGVLGRKRNSPWKMPANHVFYSSMERQYLNHCIRFSSEQLKSGVYLTPAVSVSEDPKCKYVYDLSVNPESPNFTVTNGSLLVHNSTRAMILQTLYDRGYISEDSIVVTKLGQSVVRALDKYCPEIVSVDLTKRFEGEMEEIQEGKRKPDEVIAEAESELAKILKRFKENEGKIGSELLVIVRETAKEEATIGKCPACGKDLTIRNSKAGKRFVGCSGYPDCTQTFSLPQNGYIKKTSELCKTCGLNILQIRGKGKRPWKLCIKCGFVNFKKKVEGEAVPEAAAADAAAVPAKLPVKAPAAKARKPRKARAAKPSAAKPKAAKKMVAL